MFAQNNSYHLHSGQPGYVLKTFYLTDFKKECFVSYVFKMSIYLYRQDDLEFLISLCKPYNEHVVTFNVSVILKWDPILHKIYTLKDIKKQDEGIETDKWLWHKLNVLNGNIHFIYIKNLLDYKTCNKSLHSVRLLKFKINTLTHFLLHQKIINKLMCTHDRPLPRAGL